jgi:hypothetical protein
MIDCYQTYTISVGVSPGSVTVPWTLLAQGTIIVQGTAECPKILDGPTSKHYQSAKIFVNHASVDPTAYIIADVFANAIAGNQFQKYVVVTYYYGNASVFGRAEYDQSPVTNNVNPVGSYTRGNKYGFDNPNSETPNNNMISVTTP